MLTALRILNLIAWGLVLAYMAPGVWSVLRGRSRSGDPARVGYAAFAVLVAAFNARALLIPQSEEVHAALYLLSMFVALYTFRTARSYGRGDHVG